MIYDDTSRWIFLCLYLSDFPELIKNKIRLIYLALGPPGYWLLLLYLPFILCVCIYIWIDNQLFVHDTDLIKRNSGLRAQQRFNILVFVNFDVQTF